MPRMVRGGRGNRGRGRGRRNLVTKNHLKNQLGGTKLRVANDPPSVNPFPFFQMILVFTGKGTKLFTDQSLIDGIQSQCGFTVASGFQVQVKLQKLYVWQEIPRQTTSNVPIPLQAPLSVTFYEVFGEGSISVQGDFGTEVRYAKIGYLWPVTDRIAILTANPTNDSLFRIEPVDTDQGWVCHVHVQWAVNKPKVVGDTILATGDDIAFNRLYLSSSSSSPVIV